MAKSKTEKKEETKKTEIIINKKLIDVGNLFASLGSIDRNNGENFVLIKPTEMKTTGNGILAKYIYDDIGTNVGFVPIDAKMLFSRAEGTYSFDNNKSNIEIKGGGRKSIIPLVTFDEWDDVAKKNDYAGFLIPSDKALEMYIGFKKENIITKFKLFKDDCNEIKKYQSYFGHSSNEEKFEIIKRDETLIIKIMDKQKNYKAEEIEITEGIEINNMVNSLNVIFSPKYLYPDDYTVTIYTNENSSGKKILFEGINNNITYFTTVEDNDDEVLDAEMNKKLAELDSDFENKDEIDIEINEEFSEFDIDSDL